MSVRQDGFAPWAEWFAIGVLQFRLSPDAFWRLSLVEWRWLCASAFGATDDHLTLAGLTELLSQHPDISS